MAADGYRPLTAAGYIIPGFKDDISASFRRYYPVQVVRVRSGAVQRFSLSDVLP